MNATQVLNELLLCFECLGRGWIREPDAVRDDPCPRCSGTGLEAVAS